MTDQINHSEVARLRAQIESEYAAACAGLYGLRAGSARHDFIQKQMERVADLGAELIEQIGAAAAIPLIVEMMEGRSGQPRSKQIGHDEAPDSET